MSMTFSRLYKTTKGFQYLQSAYIASYSLYSYADKVIAILFSYMVCDICSVLIHLCMLLHSSVLRSITIAIRIPCEEVDHATMLLSFINYF